MGNTVIDSRGRGSGMSDALGYLYNSSRERQTRAEEEERERRRQQAADRETRLRVAQVEFGQIHPSQRSAYIQKLSPDLQQFFLDPTTLPPPQYTPGEQADQRLAEIRRNAANNYAPTPFDDTYMTMEGVLGRNPNAQWTEATRDRSFMSPDAFRTYADEGFTPPSEVKAKEAAAAKDTAEAAYTSGVRTETERALGGKYGAETGKLREETTTERELRDPNSPATRARSTTAGRKSSTDVQLEKFNADLGKLDEKRRAIVIEIEGEKAARVALAEEEGKAPTASPFLRKKESELRATDVLRNDVIQKRDRLINGATKAGLAVPVPKSASPAAQKPKIVAPAQAKAWKHVAENPKTKQTIVSDDGVNWYDQRTGARVE